MINNIEEVLINVFYDDGSLRDLFIKETNLSDWNILMNFFKSLPNLTLSFDGEKTNQIPSSISELFMLKNEKAVLLSINYKSIIINCHFSCEDEIELDVSPREITTIKEVNAVLEFMDKLARLLNKDVSISIENDSECPLITIRSDGEYIKNY
ncbi:hypothetical protein [Gottfriedia acidiceleris]|uniref:Uncharacterized protein n=1 Tax=Gottfriedia acidiceleris TaxID=371036 RepID=A0ABY4JNQ3_9BACI|nr:hypothetical protein [Gottfriedia acidiceleris]UPM55454.1 hypothetical protein MY490_06320 [Gottfriedia acidiceleris]